MAVPEDSEYPVAGPELLSGQTEGLTSISSKAELGNQQARQVLIAGTSAKDGRGRERATGWDDRHQPPSQERIRIQEEHQNGCVAFNLTISSNAEKGNPESNRLPNSSQLKYYDYS